MAEGQPSRNLTDGGGDLSGIWQSFERATNAAPVDRYEFRRDGERYYVVRPPGGAINEGDYFTFDGAIGRHVKGPTNKMLPSGELHWDIDGWKYVSRREGAAQWNRDHTPPGGWEDIQFVQQDDTGQGVAHAPESIEILEDAPGKPAHMTEESTKNTAKIAFVVGITLFSMGLPLLIIGSISTDEDRLAMLIPGAVMFCTGIFVVIVTTKKRLGFGKRATTSEQDSASKIVSQFKGGNINRFETDAYLIKDEDLADEGDTNEPFWEIN